MHKDRTKYMYILPSHNLSSALCARHAIFLLNVVKECVTSHANNCVGGYN